MDTNGSKNIEDLIAEFVNLNPVADETKRFFKNKQTSDLFLVRHDGVTCKCITNGNSRGSNF